MSAIFGVINKNNIPVSEDVMIEINNTLQHRAPNGSQFVLSKNVGIGFCKMAIYSCQIKESQPLEDDDFILVADSRIDNKLNLAKLLSLPFDEYESIPDSILILKAYQLLGEEFLHELEGEFAIAIWDKHREKLFIATDPIGFRPLYYYEGPQQFIFCTEIKGITAVKTTQNYFNSQQLSEYFYRQSDPSETLNKQISLLCGASILSHFENSTHIRKYWNLQSTGKYSFNSDSKWIECLKELLYKAVAKRLKGAIHPIGITLSGGLDSSTIACILSELLAKENKQLHAFSSVLPANYSGEKTDEKYYIEILNKHLPNLKQVFVETPEVSPFDNIGKAFDQHETVPNAFFYMDDAIMSAVNDSGVKLLFSGYGGDYWVSRKGNSVIYQLLRKGRIKEGLKLIGKLNSVERIGWLRVFKRELVHHSKIFSGFRKAASNDWLSNEINQYSHQQISGADENADILKLINSGRMGKLVSRLLNTSAYNGIQSSDPMFDKDVCELLMDMPIRLYIQSGYKRNVIRQAMEGVLPAEIQWRRDKTAYNPDYRAQLLNNFPDFAARIYGNENSSFAYKYFNLDKLLNTADSNQLNDLSDKELIKLSQIGIAYLSIKHLEHLGYKI